MKGQVVVVGLVIKRGDSYKMVCFVSNVGKVVVGLVIKRCDSYKMVCLVSTLTQKIYVD